MEKLQARKKVYLWLLILQKHDIYIVQEPLVCFRWHQSGANPNMSAPSDEAEIRIYNEASDAIEDVIKNMDEDTLKNTFPDLMKNLNCRTENELQCEKLFVLMELSRKNVLYESSVMHFYYQLSKNTKFLDTLNEKYNYSYLDFQNYSGQCGAGKLIYQMQGLYAQYDNLQRHMQIMTEVMCMDLEMDQRVKLLRKKLYETSDIRKEMIQLTIQTLELIEKNCWDKKKVFDILCQLNIHLLRIWNNILVWDIETENSEWNQYCENIREQNIKDDIKYNKMIAFIKKIKLILVDCIEIL